MWEGIKNQAAALDIRICYVGWSKAFLGAPQRFLRRQLLRGDMGLEILQGRNDKSKLEYKLASMSKNRYPRTSV